MDKDYADTIAGTTLSTSSIIFSMAVASFICFIIAFKWKIRKLEVLAVHLPGPPGLPIIGNALEFRGTPEEIFNRVLKFTKEYESPTRIWLGPILVVIITTPEDIQIVLNSPKTMEKSEIYRFFTAYIGRGLLTAPVEKWRRNRHVLGPAFNMSLLLKHFIPVFNKHNRTLVDKLGCHVNHGQFDVRDYLVSSAMDVTSETVLGVDETTPEILKSEFAKAVARGSEIVLMRCYKFWLHSDIIFEITLRLLYGASMTKTLIEQFQRLPNLMIQKKKEEYRLRKEGQLNEEPKQKVFLDILLELSNAGTNFTDDDLRAEVIAIIIAGYDTTGQTSSFVLLMLAIHQDIQDKVYKELFQIFGDSDRDVTAEDLQQMVYTEMVIKETLRLYPIVPIFLRSVKEDIDLTHHKLPAGCTVAVSPFGVHMNPKFYPDPENFNPENFTSERIAERHKYSYLPFSAGPRNCIGLTYAMNLMKTTMAHLLRNYRISTDIKMEDIRLKTDFLLRCSNGCLLKIVRRK